MIFCLLFAAGAMHTAAAETKNVVTSAKKVTKGKWVTTKEGNKYRYSNGSYAKNAWIKINNKVYYLNNKGICETGWFTYKDNSYYASSNGQLYVKKWLTKDGDRYYFQANGVCAKFKWLTIGNKQYFFLKSGKQAKSKMFTYKDKTYFVNKNGTKVKATWVKTGGQMYYFDKAGVRLEKKWIKYKGEYRYLGTDGKIVKKAWVGNYYVNEDGIRLKNCVKDGYYLDSNGKKVIKVFKGKYIFLGDSRMEGMEISKAPADTKYIAKVSQGYDWLKKTGGVTLQYYLKANPKVKVVLALGVNDLGNINSYISYYKNLIKKYPKTEFYILSVNPVEEYAGKRYSGYVKNSQIKAFNKKLKAAFPSRYIDSYSYMWENGYETFDGLHYTVKVYQNLYDFLVKAIQ